MNLSITRHEFGLTWTARELMGRSSHALAHNGRVWLIDPLDDASVMDSVRELGEPAAVLQLLDRHNRDCAQVAGALGIPYVRLPDPGSLADTPFEVVPVARRKRWREVALWWPENQVLVVAEALGTTPLFTLGTGSVGVHPLLRLLPPSGFEAFGALTLLVGHGPPLQGAGTAAEIERALERSRRDLPRILVTLPRMRSPQPA